MSIHPLTEIRTRLRAANQSEVARQLGISRQHMSDILHNKRGIGEKVLKALGLRIRYERVKP